MKSLIVLLLLTTSVSFAHDGHDHKHDKTETSVVKTILHDFHAAMSGDNHEHDIKQSLKNLATVEGLKDWVRAFNLKKSFGNAYHYYKENKFNPVTKEHVANLVFIFPLSHSIEMLFGPVMSSLSVSMGWGASVTGALATFGAVISIPGLDPMCILIYSTYKFKAVQNMVTHIRKGTISLVGFVAKYTGVKYFYEKTWPAIQEIVFRKPEDETSICSSIFAI